MLSIIEKIKQAKALALKLTQFKTAEPTELNAIVSEMDTIRTTLGFEVNRTVKSKAVLPIDGATPVEELDTTDHNTSQLYSESERRTLGRRQKENNAAIELMNRLLEEKRPATPDEKLILSLYSGNGGGLTAANGDIGSTYEYYTPKVIAQAAWSLLEGAGFSGGKVLEPSSGTGIFASTRPEGAVMEQVELDEVSGTINGLINDSDTCKTTVSPFEAFAKDTDDEIYDAVITNVPFGKVGQRGPTKSLDPRFQDESLEAYFLLRTMQKLKPNGVAAFIVPPRVVSSVGKKFISLRQQLSMLGEFRGGYRLPNKVFSQTTEADTITDVIVFKKHPKELLAKVGDIEVSQPKILSESNVLWKQFVSGKYFNGEGKRFVLGEFQAADPNKVRDVDKVINNDSIANIAKLLVKFPDSRINWELLDQTNPEPIVYNDGDTISLSGEILKLTNGEWVKVAVDAETLTKFDNMANLLESPLQAVNQGVTWAQALEYRNHMRDLGKWSDMPQWFNSTASQLNKADAGALWNALVIGQAIHAVLDINRSKGGECNYVELYPVLSDAIKAHIADVGISADLSSSSRQFIQNLAMVYNKATGFSNEWLGRKTSVIDGEPLEHDKAYAKLVYEGSDQLGYVSIDALKELSGEFDPHDDKWCVSADGKSVILADYYYVGNYADLIAQINQEMAAATDDKTKAAIAARIAEADKRIKRPNISTMTFSLTTAFIDINAKLSFLREYVSPLFDLEYGDDGKPKFYITDKKTGDERLRQLRRFAIYLNGGNLTTGSKAPEIKTDPQLEERRVAQLNQILDDAQSKFNVWVKTNPVPLGELQSRLHNPENLFFKSPETVINLKIDGMNPEFKPHSYQFAEIFRQSKQFGGINAMQVGLGKTSTALLSVQYAQSIGVKKKTFFIVPKGLLPNWYREAAGAENKTSVLSSIDDCLFVGLRDKKGRMQVVPSKFAEDINLIMEHRHKKVFMTAEAFQQIPLKDATLQEYTDFIVSVDPSYQTEFGGKAKDKISKKAAQAELTEGVSDKKSLPYFEQMRVDSLVFDELHYNKNSKKAREFKSAKFLSLPDPSVRGIDAQIKSWWIRSQYGDGVLGLTATPITNSPVEIYAMLAMTVGEENVAKYLGGIKGTDDFLTTFCATEKSSETDIIGRLRLVNTFVGLNNVEILRNAFSQTVNVKTPEDVGAIVELPDPLETVNRIALDKETLGTLHLYKSLYVIAKENPENIALADYSPSEIGTMSHPFNLISKMSKLIMAPMLNRERTEFTIPEGLTEAASAVVAKWNGLNVIEKRDYIGQTAEEADIEVVEKVKDNGVLVQVITATVRAKIEGNTLILDTLDYDTQEKFLKLVDAAKLELSMPISPKIAAMLDNLKKERANPMRDGIVKQIVFVDNVPLHQPLKRAIASYAGISPSKIAIINGPAATPADMQDIQDGFNAEEEDNLFEVVIANEKAEVGINLQNFTQAIHHLSIGWTPDSITQRNGRGVRQGNELKTVNVYYYDAKGTFDEYKRNLVSRKGDWIGQVLSDKGGQNVEIAGSLTDQEAHDLIMSIGDEVGAERIRAESEARDKAHRAETAKGAQVRAVSVMRDLGRWLDRNSTVSSAAMTIRIKAIDDKKAANKNLAILTEKLSRSKSEATIKKLQSQIDQLKANIAYSDSITTNHAISEELAKSEMDWRRKAFDQAKAEFTNNSETQGAYGADVAEAIENGNYELVNGQIYIAGMAGEVNGRLALIENGGFEHGAVAVFLASPDNARGGIAEVIAKAGLKISIGTAKIYQKDTPEWLATIEKLAKLDDALIESKPEIIAGSKGLFSTFSKPVADRLTKQAGKPWVDWRYVIVKDAFPVAAPEAILKTCSFYNALKADIDRTVGQIEFDSDNNVRQIIGSKLELTKTALNKQVLTVLTYFKSKGIKANFLDIDTIAPLSSLFEMINSINQQDQSLTKLIDELNKAEFSNEEEFIGSINRLYQSDYFDQSVIVEAYKQRMSSLTKAFDGGVKRSQAGGMVVIDTESFIINKLHQVVDDVIFEWLNKNPEMAIPIDDGTVKHSDVFKPLLVSETAIGDSFEVAPVFARAVEDKRELFILPDAGTYKLVTKSLLDTALTGYYAGRLPKTANYINSIKNAKIAEALKAVDEVKGFSSIKGAWTINEDITITLFGGDSITFEAGNTIIVDAGFKTDLADAIMATGKENPPYARYFANTKNDKSMENKGATTYKGWVITVEPTMTKKGVPFTDLAKLKALIAKL